MTAPKFIDIGGQRFVGREPLHRRREQLAAPMGQLFDLPDPDDRSRSGMCRHALHGKSGSRDVASSQPSQVSSISRSSPKT